MMVMDKDEVSNLIITATKVADKNRMVYEREISDLNQRVGGLLHDNECLLHKLKGKDEVIKTQTETINGLHKKLEKLERRNAYLERKINEMESAMPRKD